MFIKNLVSLLASQRCLGCGSEGVLACKSCLDEVIVKKAATCFRCNRLSPGWRTCSRCRSYTKLNKVVVASEYEGIVKQLVGWFKYHNGVSAAQTLAWLMKPHVEELMMDAEILVPVPSSPKRYRQRGYNPAFLLAKELSSMFDIEVSQPLRRIGHSRQVGADREARLQQLSGKIYAADTRSVTSRKVILVDDVLTTGATLDECCKALLDAGAKSADAAVVAKH